MIYFQIPYVLMLFGAGLPILFLEICLGQYAGVGPIQIFGIMAPILKGLGYVNIKKKLSTSFKVFLFLMYVKNRSGQK